MREGMEGLAKVQNALGSVRLVLIGVIEALAGFALIAMTVHY